MTTWLILSDGEHARVITPGAAKGQFVTVLSFDSATAHKATRDLGTARPSSIPPRQDLHIAAKHSFIVEVAKQVTLHVDEFDQLVLISPAHALHDLRQALGESANLKIVATLAKDLTKIMDHDLMSHLAIWWHPSSEA